MNIQEHQEWQHSLLTPQDIDEIEDFDDLIEIDPYVPGTNNRRSDKELAKMLDLLDNLPISENGKEGSI